MTERDYVTRSLRRRIYVFVSAAHRRGNALSGDHYFRDRGPRFGPTPSRSRGRRLSAVIVQSIDAAQPELSLPLKELPCFYLIFYNRELARASRKLVIRPIRLLHVIIFILLFSIIDISFVRNV